MKSLNTVKLNSCFIDVVKKPNTLYDYDWDETLYVCSLLRSIGRTVGIEARVSIVESNEADTSYDTEQRSPVSIFYINSLKHKRRLPWACAVRR